MTKAAFLVAYPEFASAEDSFSGLIDAKLAQALDSTSDSYGARLDAAHGLLTAHLLALSPFGVNAKLANETGGSTYLTALNEMRAINACAKSRVR